MPRSNKSTTTHSCNVIIACLTQLIVYFREFLSEMGVKEGPVIDSLRQMELVLPTCLNLTREFITDEEAAQLGIGGTEPPTTTPTSPSTNGPASGATAGKDNATWENL